MPIAMAKSMTMHRVPRYARNEPLIIDVCARVRCYFEKEALTDHSFLWSIVLPISLMSAIVLSRCDGPLLL